MQPSYVEIAVGKCFEVNCEVRPGHVANISLLIALMITLGTGE